MTVATLSPEPTAEGLPRWVGLLRPAAALAERLAATDFVPRAMRGKPEAVAAAILLGDELDVGPMQALAHIHVVEGRPCPSAELMRALVLRHGHALWTEDATTSQATVCGQRAGSDRVESVTWTISDAQRAGLVRTGSAWVKYPRSMLVARATSELCRRVFPDALGGLSYLAEELEAEAPSAGAPAGRRQRVSRAATVTTASAPVEDAAQQSGAVDLSPTAGVVPTSPEGAPMADAVPGAPSPDTITAEPPTTAQMRKLQAMLNAAGIKERPERLAIASLIAGRALDSSSELTKHEASELLDVLEHITTGVLSVIWEQNAEGVLTPALVVPDQPTLEGIEDG